jgi:P27 family predicted phage terminase small subunit
MREATYRQGRSDTGGSQAIGNHTDDGHPAPPSGLLKASRDRWAEFWASPAAATVNLQSDLPRLLRWIGQTDEYDRVAKVCRKARLVKGSTGQPVLNPLIGYLGQLEGQIARAEAEFGMTPMARHRMRMGEPPAEPATEVDPVDDIAARRLARRNPAG